MQNGEVNNSEYENSFDALSPQSPPPVDLPPETPPSLPDSPMPITQNKKTKKKALLLIFGIILLISIVVATVILLIPKHQPTPIETISHEDTLQTLYDEIECVAHDSECTILYIEVENHIKEQMEDNKTQNPDYYVDYVIALTDLYALNGNEFYMTDYLEETLLYDISDNSRYKLLSYLIDMQNSETERLEYIDQILSLENVSLDNSNWEDIKIYYEDMKNEIEAQ